METTLHARTQTSEARSRPRDRRAAVMLAGLTTVLLGFDVTAASAAESPYVDQDHPVSSFTGNWKAEGGHDIAQPYQPNSPGVAVDLTVAINAGDGAGEANHFTAAEIRPFPVGGEIGGEAIPGGTGVLSFPEEQLPNTPLWCRSRSVRN